MRSFALSFVLLFSCFVYAESIHLVRIGVFAEDPKTVALNTKKLFQTEGYTKAASRELGMLTPQGYYFHTFLPLQDIANLLKVTPGRKVVTFEQRPQPNKNGKTQLILTVSRELPVYNQDNFRLFQVAQNPARDIQNIMSYLRAMSIDVEPLLSANPDHVQQLRFQARPNQLNFILKLALQTGPIDLRQEVPVQDVSQPIKVRIVVDKSSVARSYNRRADEMRTYTFNLSTLDEQPQLFDSLKVDANNKFLFEEGKLGSFALSLAKLGPVLLDTKADSTPISEGKLRGQLQILSLFHTDLPIAPSVAVKVPEKMEPPVAQIPKPDHFNISLKAEMPEVALHDESPLQTYRRELPLKGFANVGQSLEPLEGNSHIEPGSEPGEFIWKLQNLEKGKTQERRLRSRSAQGTTEMKYQVYRGYAWNLSAAYGMVPNSKNKLTQVAVPNIRYWFEDTFQRFGLAVHSEHILDSNPDKVFSPIVAVDLKYRLTPGLQEYNDSFIFNISNQNVKTSKGNASFLGAGLEYSATLPWLIDFLLNWIPFLDYPKRIDFGLFYYPQLFGGKNSLKLNIQYYIEPKMYFNPRFYIFGRAQQSQFNFTIEERNFKSNLFLGYGGFGFLF